MFAHSGADAAGRTPLAAVREGQVLRGTIVAQLLHHGAQVDLGAEYDGILPCQDEQWEEAGELLPVGSPVEVTVHRVRDPRLFRFPIHVRAARVGPGAGAGVGAWPSGPAVWALVGSLCGSASAVAACRCPASPH